MSVANISTVVLIRPKTINRPNTLAFSNFLIHVQANKAAWPFPSRKTGSRREINRDPASRPSSTIKAHPVPCSYMNQVEAKVRPRVAPSQLSWLNVSSVMEIVVEPLYVPLGAMLELTDAGATVNIVGSQVSRPPIPSEVTEETVVVIVCTYAAPEPEFVIMKERVSAGPPGNNGGVLPPTVLIEIAGISAPLVLP